MDVYLHIMNHFGCRNQMKKLNEETYELLEAIDGYEDALASDNVEELRILRDHVIEEMGDVLILLTEFIGNYDIKKPELDFIMDYKINRTLERIDMGYYDK